MHTIEKKLETPKQLRWITIQDAVAGIQPEC